MCRQRAALKGVGALPTKAVSCLHHPPSSRGSSWESGSACPSRPTLREGPSWEPTPTQVFCL